MSYKPDESVLMAYLYGELDGREKEDVQQFLDANPEEFRKLQELSAVVNVIAHVKDKEVIAPPILMDDSSRLSFMETRYFKMIMSIAASLLLLLVAGKVLGPDIRYRNGELRISFGNPKEEKILAPEQAVTASLTPQEVQDLINASLIKTTAAIDNHLTSNQEKMNSTIRQSLDQNSKKVDELITKTTEVSKQQLQSYVSSLQNDNLKLMKDYLSLSSKEQNAYVENLLVGFSKYIQEQRASDLQLVQSKVNSLEKESDQFKQETEQLLTSIITNTSKKNSY